MDVLLMFLAILASLANGRWWLCRSCSGGWYCSLVPAALVTAITHPGVALHHMLYGSHST